MRINLPLPQKNLKSSQFVIKPFDKLKLDLNFPIQKHSTMNSENERQYRTIFQKFIHATPMEIEQYADESATLVLPNAPSPLVQSLCSDVGDIFREEPCLLEISSPCIIIGDIHGHILDLLRVLKVFGLPDKTPFVFLGDLVDRGEFSVETVILVFLLKVLFPDNVHIIRGNHEFEFMSTQCGFSKQIDHFYDNGQELFESFLVTFSSIPLGCLIDGTTLCMHGGLGPGVFSLSQFRKQERPINDFGEDFVNSVLWSDPHEGIKMYAESTRGTGYYFGCDATKEFCEANNIHTIVRGHECVLPGIKWMFDRSVVTVFTASNYCGLMGNNAGVLEVKGPDQFEEHKFPPLQYLKRSAAIFKSTARNPRRRLGTMPAHSAGKIPTVSTLEKLPSLNHHPTTGSTGSPHEKQKVERLPLIKPTASMGRGLSLQGTVPCLKKKLF